MCFETCSATFQEKGYKRIMPYRSFDNRHKFTFFSSLFVLPLCFLWPYERKVTLSQQERNVNYFVNNLSSFYIRSSITLFLFCLSTTILESCKTIRDQQRFKKIIQNVCVVSSVIKILLPKTFLSRTVEMRDNKYCATRSIRYSSAFLFYLCLTDYRHMRSTVFNEQDLMITL
jgi:hypothetical protein